MLILKNFRCTTLYYFHDSLTLEFLNYLVDGLCLRTVLVFADVKDGF